MYQELRFSVAPKKGKTGEAKIKANNAKTQADTATANAAAEAGENLRALQALQTSIDIAAAPSAIIQAMESINKAAADHNTALKENKTEPLSEEMENVLSKVAKIIDVES